MNLHVRKRVAALLLAATPLAACSPAGAGVTAPAGGPSLAVAGPTAERVVALTRKEPLPGGITASVYVTPERGGTLIIREAGLTVTVPAGAVSAPTVITAAAHAGKLVAYDFGPHGTRFLVPIRVKQELKPTSWYKLVDRSQVEAGYFQDASQIDVTTGSATIDEFLPVELTQSGNRLEFDVVHFSGYLLSTGRSR